MSSDKIAVRGTVKEVCRGGQFRCEALAGEETVEIMAYASGKIKKFAIKIVVGDAVDIEVSPYDLSRGRIVFRDK